MTEQSESEAQSSVARASDYITDEVINRHVTLRSHIIEKFIPSDISFIRKPRASLIYSRKRALQDEKILEEEHINGILYSALKATKRSRYFNRLTSKILMKITSSLFQSLLSLFACIVYVINTYYEDRDDNQDAFEVLEIVIAFLFAVDYLFGFYVVKHKKKFMLNTLNIIDLVTILPVFIYLLSESESQSTDLAFARLLRVVRVIRVLRLYRLFTVSNNLEH